MLRISLRDGEQIIVNGAVLRAKGRITFEVENKSAILRGRDVMQPCDADTPARRLYFACMLAYIDPDAAEAHHASAAALAEDLFAALTNPEMRAGCRKVIEELDAGRHYGALVLCRGLIHYEATHLARPVDTAAGASC